MANTDNYKTILEFAENLNVTPQTIYYHINKKIDKKALKEINGTIVLNAEQQRVLKGFINKNILKETVKETAPDFDENFKLSVARYQEIKNLRKQNNNLQKLLDQQQKLQLKTQQLFEEKFKLIENNDEEFNKKIEMADRYQKIMSAHLSEYVDRADENESTIKKLTFMVFGLIGAVVILALSLILK